MCSTAVHQCRTIVQCPLLYSSCENRSSCSPDIAVQGSSVPGPVEAGEAGRKHWPAGIGQGRKRQGEGSRGREGQGEGGRG